MFKWVASLFLLMCIDAATLETKYCETKMSKQADWILFTYIRCSVCVNTMWEEERHLRAKY